MAADVIPEEKPPDRISKAGLCANCLYVRIVVSDRQSEFYRCMRSDRDPAFPRYPSLPVLRCAGWSNAKAHHL
jgi:hypothetical protein